MHTLPGAHTSLVESPGGLQTATPVSPIITALPLRIVAIKTILLLAARSFAAPSEYLKIHLDTISSAINASLGTPCDDLSLEERERRWQLWSFICVLDWTSVGINHNGSYFIRPELHSNPPSKIVGIPNDGSQTPPMELEQLEHLTQMRYFLEHALSLASLSRRAEDCIIRPGPISSGQAAEICSELDALDHKLGLYQLLGVGGRNNNFTAYADLQSRLTGGSSTPMSDEYHTSARRALQIQNAELSLEIGLIRFKLFRHEAFFLMHDPSTSEALRMMCMDACMDACIVVLSRCRNIGMSAPRIPNFGESGVRGDVNDFMIGDIGQHDSFPGIFRRVIQPASSAALVGQVLLHAFHTVDGLGLLVRDKQSDMARSTKWIDAGLPNRGIPLSGFHPSAQQSMGSFGPSQMANSNSSASWFQKEKLDILQRHVNTVVSELEALESTSAMARYRLGLHRQCI